MTNPAVSEEMVERLRNRAHNWRNNGDKARVSVPLGEIRAALSALSVALPLEGVDAVEELRARVTALEQALERIRRLISYPVSTEITARGWDIHIAPDAPEYMMEIIDAALSPKLGEEKR